MKKPREILNYPICIDDFGSEVYLCQYTKKVVMANESIFIGACIPQASGSYVCAIDAMPAYKLSKAAFNEMDANCNACKHLERIPFKKQHPANVMRGVCTHHPYKTEVTFRPDDYMGMKCWEARA